MILISLLIAVALSWGLTALIRLYALKRHVVDIPNQRSSHQQPTPRGGGMAFVISFLLLARLPWPVILACILIAGIGFLDDHRSVSARIRFVIHAVSVGLLLWTTHGFPSLQVGPWLIHWGWLGTILGLFGLIWLINLYNFMDGIDGIAGIEAVTVLVAVLILHSVAPQAGAQTPLWLPCLAACIVGFLIWNWPPAKIFMGDGGSGFLGLILGYAVLSDATVNPQWLWVWLILLGGFVVDATWTLLHRARLRLRLSQPHRTHAYQYASRRYGSHLRVTLAAGALNLCWLLPIAYCVSMGLCTGIAGLLVAYSPLCWLAWRFKAGTPETPITATENNNN
jgi:Fuc2NAc and GlcNAc transferase